MYKIFFTLFIVMVSHQAYLDAAGAPTYYIPREIVRDRLGHRRTILTVLDAKGRKIGNQTFSGATPSMSLPHPLDLGEQATQYQKHHRRAALYIRPSSLSSPNSDLTTPPIPSTTSSNIRPGTPHTIMSILGNGRSISPTAMLASIGEEPRTPPSKYHVPITKTGKEHPKITVAYPKQEIGTALKSQLAWQHKGPKS